jgi:hypothetical protein
MGWACPGPVLKLRHPFCSCAFDGQSMTAAFLKWLANGMIGLVMVSTLWLAHSAGPGLVAPAHVQIALLALPAGAAASQPAP